MKTESDAPDSAGDVSVEKRSLVSVPFLVIAISVGVAIYFCGPWLMAQAMFIKGVSPVAEAPDDESTIEGDGGYDGAGEGRSGGGGQGGRRGGADPEAIWARIDADGNGIVEGAEISERMKDRVSEIDADGDGAITKEEFFARIASRRASRGGAGSGRPERPGSSQEEASEEGSPKAPAPEAANSAGEQTGAGEAS